MNIKQIGIISSQVFEGIFKGEMERFRIISSVDNLVSSRSSLGLARFKIVCILRRNSESHFPNNVVETYLSRNEKFIAYAALLCPFPNKSFRTAILIVSR